MTQCGRWSPLFFFLKWSGCGTPRSRGHKRYSGPKRSKRRSKAAADAKKQPDDEAAQQVDPDVGDSPADEHVAQGDAAAEGDADDVDAAEHDAASVAAVKYLFWAAWCLLILIYGI